MGKGLRKNADCCLQAVGGVNVVDCLPSQQPAWWSPLIAFVCWKTLSFSHFLLVFYSHAADHLWAGPLVYSSPPQLKAVISFPSPLLHSLIWGIWKQIFSIRGSRWKCLLQAAALLLLSLPPLRSFCCLVPPPNPTNSRLPTPRPHSQHSQGGSEKRWVTFKHFYPFHSAADLFVPAHEVLIGGEELSLAGSQDFSPGWCKFCFLTPSFLIANALSDWLVFLRTLLTYLEDYGMF